MAPTGKEAIDRETGLFNWSYFEAELAKEWSRATRAEIPLSVLYIKVFRLETFFELYGEVAGNEALVKTARALSEVIKRPGDVLARKSSD